MYVENLTKITDFPTPLYLTPPMKGFPVEFGIGVRGPKCLNDGPTRWSKTFSGMFSRFDTIPAVTDTQPASHPASKPRCRSYTLNAKASSLKTNKHIHLSVLSYTELEQRFEGYRSLVRRGTGPKGPKVMV